jgi:AbiV family abortive infection protein
MARAKSAAPLSLADISDATRRLLKNASELIAEAELLCRHSHFARSFALSVIAIEEASKILEARSKTGSKLRRRSIATQKN